MRLRFQERPWDLYVAVGYTVVIAVVLLAVNEGDVLAILFVLFAPGYVLVAALFPRGPLPEKPEIDWVERIALSFGLSIAIVPLLGLLLNYTPFGIRFGPMVEIISIFTVCVGWAAYMRRMQLPPGQRLSLNLDLRLPDWTASSAVDKGLALLLGASVVIAGGTFAYIILKPNHDEPFTEFFILGPAGDASGYPTQLNVSENGTVLVGVVNHEAATVAYTIRVDLVGVRIVYNATAGFNETIDVNRTTWSWYNVTLSDGRNWTRSYAFRIDHAGSWKVPFLLFKDGDFSSAYRELHLYVRVA